MRILLTRIGKIMSLYPFDRQTAVGEAVDPLDLTPIEGDYSTWTLLKTFTALTDMNWIRFLSSFNGDETMIIVVDYYYYPWIFDVAAGTATQGTTRLKAQGDVQDADKSAFGKYYVAIDYATDQSVYVYKDGNVVQTIDVTDLVNDSFEGVVVSRSGQYILIILYDGSEPMATRFKGLLYQGS